MKMKISARFRPIFDFELNGKRSRAELKIFQLELWLEPAWLGLITSVQYILIFSKHVEVKPLTAILIYNDFESR